MSAGWKMRSQSSRMIHIMRRNLESHKVEISGGFWGCCSEDTHTHMNKSFTCAQYWDFATATRSFSMGWDCDTRGETAWMTAVNLGYGLIPETQQKDGHSIMLSNTPRKQRRLEHGEPTVSHQCNFFEENKAGGELTALIPKPTITIFSERCYLKRVCQQFKNIDDLIVSDVRFQASPKIFNNVNVF